MYRSSAFVIRIGLSENLDPVKGRSCDSKVDTASRVLLDGAKTRLVLSLQYATFLK